MSDASGAVPLGTNCFAVADNEQTCIKIYRRDRGGPPLKSFDFASFLEVEPRRSQVDIEAAARIGDRAFWLSSHGRNVQSKFSPNRQRLFATDIKSVGDAFELVPAGKPYKDLLSDLVHDPHLKRFNLAEASQKAPKSSNALNLEGLCATPDGQLLIGFRNPIPEGRALIVPLSNPDQVINGKPARLGEPQLLDLHGLGIRDLAYTDNKYVIIGGPYAGKGHFRLYWWSGNASRPEHIKGLKFGDLHPEAIVLYPDKGLREFQLLSDDGTRLINGKVNKDLPVPQRQFRGVWVTP